MFAFVKAQPRRGVALAAAVVLLILFGPALAEHLRLSRDHFRFSDDVRVLIAPQFRLEDPQLFPRDPVVAYYLASLPDGYALVYRALTPLFGVVALSKGLPYVLLACGLTALALTAWRLAGDAAAFGSLALALGSSYLLWRMTGGLPRGFAAPLLAAGTLALVEGRVRALAVLAVVAAGFYPAAALTLGVALTLLLLMPATLRGAASGWSLPRRAGVVALTGGAAGLVLLPAALRLRAWGSAIGPDLIARYPEAGPFGRFAAADRAPFPALPTAALAPLRAALVGDGAPIAGPFDARAHAAWLVPLVAVLGLVGCGSLAWGRVEARRFLLLPLAMLACHTLSLVLVPRLFLPERYVAYAVPVIVLVAVPATLGALSRASRGWMRALPWVYNAAIILLLGARGVPWIGLTVYIAPAERPLFRAIANLPNDAVIAAFPSETSDCIPYLSRRSVFLAWETHMPFHTRYTELMRSRAQALFDAYFTSDPEVLRRFRERQGVTHLLVDARQLASQPGYFAPFNEQIGRNFKAGKANGFAVESLRAKTAIYEAGNYTLLDLSRL
jgi:hypothetical protein